MIFNKIYEKLDRSISEINTLKMLSGRENHQQVGLLIDMSESIDFLNKQVVAVRQDFIDLQQTITDLKNSLTTK